MLSSCEPILFDEEGEILLLLETNDANCDQWRLLHSDSSDLAVSDDATTNEPAAIEALPDEPGAYVSIADEAPADEPAADELFAVVVPVQDSLADETRETQADSRSSDALNDGARLVNEVAQSQTTSTRHIAMQVSYKHLVSASRFFKDMFKDTGWDSRSTNDRKPVPIPLAGDDLRSMCILLNIIHGLNGRVPRRVGKRDLLRIVKLIDKYEFHEAAEFCTDVWFDALRPSMPRTFHPGLATWIYICWHLKKPKEMDALVKIAIWESSTDLDDLDGLVPDWIIGEKWPSEGHVNRFLIQPGDIQSRRQQILVKLVDLLSELSKNSLNSRRRCFHDDDCDALLTGKFLKALAKDALFPIPEPASLSRSISSLFSIMRGIELDPLCEKSSRKPRRGLFHEGSSQAGHLGEELRKSLSSIEDEFHPLDIHLLGEKDDHSVERVS